MTDSSLGTNSGDGAFDVGSSTDELFGEFADETLEGDTAAASTTDDGTDGSEAIEDRTAADVFDQLRANAAGGADEVLADESPEDIIATADEPDPEPALDDDLRVDDDELADLLLTGRTKGEEFLWVDSESDDGSANAAAEPSTGGTDPAAETAAGDSIADDTVSSGADGAEESSPEVDATGETDSTVTSDGETAPDTDGDADPDVDLDGTAATAGPGPDAESAVDGGLDMITDRKRATESETSATVDSDADTDGDADVAATDEETALVATDDGDVPATTDDGGSSGILGWLRTKLGGLF